MSGILLRWLNEDLALKQRVLNVEHDFSNGYLLGEILHMHNHQQNFCCFQESSTSEAKINNFILLEPSLRLLGVHFDAQVAYNVIQATAGSASKLLYQVKMVLDRLSKFSTPVSMRPTITAGGVKPLPNSPQRTIKPQFDRATHSIFASTVRDMMQSQKGINLERSLRRFKKEGARQKRLVKIQKERSLLAEELHTEAIRMQGLHDLAQRKALCDSWEEDNVDDWMVNMDRKRDRETRNHLFLRKVERTRLSRLQRARMVSKRAVENDIPEFEARSRETMRTANCNQDEQESTAWAVAASNRGLLEARALDKSYQWQMAKFKEKRSGERAGAREKRRRRYTTEREESLCHEYLQEGTNVLKQKLMKSCRAEENVETQLESVFRYKAIMTENRKYRAQQYAARAEVDAEGLLKRDQASLDSCRRQCELGVRAHLERCQASRNTRAAARATRVEKICRETLDGIVALSMEVVVFRNYHEHRTEPDATSPDQDPIPRRQWMDMKWTFIRGNPLLRMEGFDKSCTRIWGCTPLLPLATGVDVALNLSGSPDQTTEMDDSTETIAQFLDNCELQDYISETGLWSAKEEDGATDGFLDESGGAAEAVEAHENSSLSTSDSSRRNNSNTIVFPDSAQRGLDVPATIADNILRTANPLHALGECVIEVSLAADPLPSAPVPPSVPEFSLRICMCGNTSSGKSEQAIRLAERYCLKVLSAEELAQCAMDNAANAMAAGRKVLSAEEALGQQANSTVLQGGSISDEVYAALLVLGIKEIDEENRTMVAKAQPGEKDLSEDGDYSRYMGWIIDDFPGTIEQAAILEKHLSGYDETAHVWSRKDLASKLAPAAPVSETLEQKELVSSGIDLVIFIEVARETILKRSLGRMFDPVTGERYHFEGPLPQYDALCKERLVHPEDPENASAQLALLVAAQEESSEQLKTFISKFGTLRTIDTGECTPDALFGKINLVVVTMVQETQVERNILLGNGHQTSDVGIWDGAVEYNSDAHVATKAANTTAETKIGAGDPGTIVGKSGDASANQPVHGGDVGLEGSVSSSMTGVDQKDYLNMLGGTTEGGGAKSESCGGLPLDGLMAAISRHWRAAEKHFEDTIRRVSRELRNQRLLLGDHVRELRNRFFAFLERADNKQAILVDFCSSFNSVDKDLRFDERACKELLLRAEECRSKLWYDVEERRGSAGRALHSIKEDRWVERQKGMVFNHMMVLMQAEVERFHAGASLVHDYFQSKTQEILRDDSVVLTSLLPAEEIENAAGASKDNPNKADGKKEKDKDGGKGRGGTQKGQDKKGKGGKGDTAIEYLSALPGRRTAMPPCLILPNLVDVVAAASSIQTADDVEDLGLGAAGGKRKTDKNKKNAKKSASKTEGQEAEDAQQPLTAALDMVLGYAGAWGPKGFPVPPTEQVLSEVNDGTANGNHITKERQPPNALLLHRAIWAQVAVLAKRARLLHRVGQDLAVSIQRKADLIHAELQSCLDTRVAEESCAVEAAMAKARDCIDNQAPIEHEWILRVDTSVRLVPPPDILQTCAGVEENLDAFVDSHEDRLREALKDGDESALVTLQVALDVLLRLSEGEGILPDRWACLTNEQFSQILAALDPDDTGQVEVDTIVDMIRNKRLEDVLC